MLKGDKLRQIRCRLLSLFVAQVRLRHFDLYDRKGMVSRRKWGFKEFTSTRFDGWGERKKHTFHARTSGTGLRAIWPRFRRLVSSD
jgi:hypothetical protein